MSSLLIISLNEPEPEPELELICFHTVKWFQNLLRNTNNSM